MKDVNVRLKLDDLKIIATLISEEKDRYKAHLMYDYTHDSSNDTTKDMDLCTKFSRLYDYLRYIIEIAEEEK